MPNQLSESNQIKSNQLKTSNACNKVFPGQRENAHLSLANTCSDLASITLYYNAAPTEEPHLLPSAVENRWKVGGKWLVEIAGATTRGT